VSLLLKFVVLLKDIKEFDMNYNRDERKSLNRQTEITRTSRVGQVNFLPM